MVFRVIMWNAEREAVVRDMYPDNASYPAILDAINALPGKQVTIDSLRNFVRKLCLTRPEPAPKPSVVSVPRAVKNEWAGTSSAREALSGEPVPATIPEVAAYIRRYAPHLRSLAELQVWRRDRGLPPFEVVMRRHVGDVGIGTNSDKIGGPDKPSQKKPKLPKEDKK